MNFRDVADSLELVANEPIFPHGHLLRGGKISEITDARTIGNPSTILNLRRGPGRERFPQVLYRHSPAINNVENYDTSIKEVRRWLNESIAVVADSSNQIPILLHCTSGKDRTGVVVAAILTILGIERSLIIEEYLLSDGEVRQDWIELTLDGIGDVDDYFNRVSPDAVRARFPLPPAE